MIRSLLLRLRLRMLITEILSEKDLAELVRSFNDKVRMQRNDGKNPTLFNHLKDTIMNCDNCKHYCWYYDKCSKWDCEVDFREVHNCYEPIETAVRDMMIDISRTQ